RRRDKAELTGMRQLLDGQTAELTAQAKRIQELEGRLAGAQAQLTKLSQLDEFLQQFKDEVALMLKEYDEQRRKDEAEAHRLRQMERESQARALAKIRKELQKLSRHEEELQARKAEERRLNEVLMGLQQKAIDLGKKVEKPVNDLVYLKGQFQRDSKRIAELEGRTAKLLELSEAQATGLTLLKEESARHKRQFDKLLESRQERQKEQKRLMETMGLNELRWQKQMEAWAEEAEELQRKAEEFGEHFQHFREQYSKNKRALKDLEKLRESLKQGQAEVAELQRLAEERMRGRMEEWREESGKRWKEQLTLWEHQWGEQKKHNEELRARLKQLEEWSHENQSQILALWKARREYARRQMAEVEQQITEAEEYVSGS
ncbi:MAG: hypothetical protein U9R11_03720, partial [Chloroflexota bacterium]|nr:hypothetical protein [Chloroflexota bacterium]